MKIARVVVGCAAIVAIGVVLVSGGSEAGPRTPQALPGLPPPFLGTAVAGEGGLTAAVDAYGDVVDLRAPGPAGRALIDNPSDRQAAGTVPVGTGIVPRVRIGDSPPLPLWRGESVRQGYLRRTNVVRTVARVHGARVVVLTAVAGGRLAMRIVARGGGRGRAAGHPRARPAVSVHVAEGVHCAHEGRAGPFDLICKSGRAVPPVHDGAPGKLSRECETVLRDAVTQARQWSRRSLPLGGEPEMVGHGRRRGASSSTHPGVLRSRAPAWAREMYRRSLLTIHALTSRRTGAVAAGARDGWAYVWPRDAATAALALEASGHRAEARSVARFLTGLDLSAAARFDEAGVPVPGRAAQGDALGWVDAAARAAGVPAPDGPFRWRNRADYQESTPGTYLGNALAAAATHVDGPRTGHIGGFSAHQRGSTREVRQILREFGTERGLVRSAGDPGSGLDSAAGWAVRPFGLRALYPAARKTLLRLVEDGTRYGITPGEGWSGGEDPWLAPSAWSAWALAGLAAEAGHRATAMAAGDRRAALTLLRDLRHASTPAGDLPERVGAHTGIPTSTTPLLWSSAFAVLALRELWP
ncbi:MAG: hypothetical protein JSS68_12660 [Actinobacteria bacterium]|nr:hypothetical protein [Actinomycetota bacterium]